MAIQIITLWFPDTIAEQPLTIYHWEYDLSQSHFLMQLLVVPFSLLSICVPLSINKELSDPTSTNQDLSPTHRK